MKNISRIQEDNINNNTCNDENSCTAVAWSAIIAGTLIATVVLLILLFLGSAFGLASVSPWANVGVATSTLTVATIAWLVLMQCIASGFGGYLTGRLRSKWVSMHTDEVYFRDTAHGLLSWALTTVITVALLASTISAIVGGGVKAASTVVAAGVSEISAQNMGIEGYLVDSLFRADGKNAIENNMRAETMRILASGVTEGVLSPNDKAYLTQAIAVRTGLTKEEASKRLETVIAKLSDAKATAKQALETARQRTMHGALYTFLSLLVGAFIASYAAACGGRHRDTY